MAMKKMCPICGGPMPDKDEMKAMKAAKKMKKMAKMPAMKFSGKVPMGGM